jgi:integrase
MANLFRPTYTKTDPETGERHTGRLRKWYAKYHDADGVLRRVPLCEDKAAAQAMLTELVRKVERRQAGLTDPFADELARPLDDHLHDYRTHLLAKARSEKHISETIRVITNVSQSCCWRVLADLQRGGDQLEAYLAERLEAGNSYRTINADLVAVRSFCRWLIGRKRMVNEPTSGLERLNVEEDRRRERRALTEEEAQRLVQTTFDSTRVFRDLVGATRAMLYLVAQRTGLRRNELRSLTKQSFNLESDLPTVAVKARQSKRRKYDILPLTDDVAAAVRGFLEGREPSKPLWPGTWWRRSAEMLRLDLAEAGIEAVDAEGHVVDFHGQRTTFITSLARAGVTPATAQRLARHSDINLTLGTYTRLKMEDLSHAVGQLPNLRPGSKSESAAAPSASQSDGQAAAEDSELSAIAAVWKDLPQQIRQAIMMLVSSGRQPPKQTGNRTPQPIRGPNGDQNAG